MLGLSHSSHLQLARLALPPRDIESGKNPNFRMQSQVLLFLSGCLSLSAPCHSLFYPQIQTRNICHLPDILVINCEVNSLKEADFWRMQAEVRTQAGNSTLGVLFHFLPPLTSIYD